MKVAYVASMILAVSMMGSVAQAADKVDPKSFDATIDSALKGYNDGDFKVFFADYAKSMASFANEKVFKAMYVDMYKKSMGDYVSRKPIDNETVVTDSAATLAFDAEFSKEKKVKLNVALLKEDGRFKISAIRLVKQ